MKTCDVCGETIAPGSAVCPFCGTAYVVEKAVNNYNTVNNNQIQAQVVNIYGGDLSGNMGVIGIKSGTLNISGGRLSATTTAP